MHPVKRTPCRDWFADSLPLRERRGTAGQTCGQRLEVPDLASDLPCASGISVGCGCKNCCVEWTEELAVSAECERGIYNDLRACISDYGDSTRSQTQRLSGPQGRRQEE